ncbi:MAG: hypothetical protein JRM77_09520 [Nitrososphaerota archaeon]|jgi:hypothetical protein|nr:hypothetical protein [Nitrososphaerota archaeon]
MTPEELLVLETLPPGDRVISNVVDIVATLTPMASKIAEFQSKLDPEGEHTLDTVLDDIAFSEAFFKVFQLGKETYGDRFAIVAVLLRDDHGSTKTAFFPQQFGATSDIIEKTMKGRFGARLLAIVSSQMTPR